MKKIVIAGAGITGLSLAHALKKRSPASCTISILEKSSRTGGWIQTINRDNFLFELGPRSCRPKGNGLYTLQLIEELEITDRVILGDPSAKNRYLYTGNKLQALPSGLLSALTSPLMRGVPRVLFKERNIPPLKSDDESIYEFFCRRFDRHITETFVDPMCSGIYAGDIKKLSIRSCFPKIYHWEQTHGSVLRGAFAKKSKESIESPFIKKVQKSNLFSFRNGMHVLTDALEKKLQDTIRYNTSITKITHTNNSLCLSLNDHSTLLCDHLFLCIPSNQSRQLLPGIPEMELSSVVVACVGYNNDVLNKRGFGHLVPSKENEEILGIVWDSSVFPHQNNTKQQTRLTAMLGGAKRPDMIDKPEAELEKIVFNAIKRQLGISAVPTHISINYAKNAIPQYTVGHINRIQQIKKYKNITLLGNSYNGVAVNDCIAEATLAAQSLLP